MTPDDFFGLVDEYLSPAMAGLGYRRIPGTENTQPMSRGPLMPSLSRTERNPVQRVYEVGFEASSAEVQRRVCPQDPDSADELWLSYDPKTGELDFRAWAELAGELLDWDPWRDRGPCYGEEVRRRLSAVGSAVSDVANEHD